MNAHVPRLSLTHGQLAWVVALGQFLPPPRWRHLMAQLRYLRQLGIPFREAQRGKGRGHRIRYSYDELMEVAVGLYALRQDVRPHVIAKILLRNRARLRRVYREALAERPQPLNSRGCRAVARSSPYPRRRAFCMSIIGTRIRPANMNSSYHRRLRT